MRAVGLNVHVIQPIVCGDQLETNVDGIANAIKELGSKVLAG